MPTSHIDITVLDGTRRVKIARVEVENNKGPLNPDQLRWALHGTPGLKPYVVVMLPVLQRFCDEPALVGVPTTTGHYLCRTEKLRVAGPK
jgi:hypothetical protein